MEMLAAEQNRVEHVPNRLLQAIDSPIDNLWEELTGLTTPSTALTVWHPPLETPGLLQQSGAYLSMGHTF
jgi:hypothetical protein